MSYIEYKLASVIVPIYKVEKYINRCIDSILAQTYSNLEIILVDDGSPDMCGTICDEYMEKDERITVIHKENGGLSDARNEGIKHSHGEYVFFVDSDDWIDPDYCSAAIFDLEDHNADVVVFGYNKVNEDGQLVDMCYSLSPQIMTKDKAIQGLIEGTIDNYAWNKVYRRRVFDGIEYPRGMLWEDIGTTYRVFDKCEYIYISNRVTYNYLVRNSSITATHSFKADIDIFIQRKQQYDFLAKKYSELAPMALPTLADSAIQAYIHIPEEQKYSDLLEQVVLFLKNNKKDILALGKSKGRAKLIGFYTNHRVFRLFAKLFLKIKGDKSRRLHGLSFFSRVIKKMSRFIKQKKGKEGVEKLWKDSRPKIYIIGTPDHDNLGDHTIALATEQYLGDYLTGYEIIDITEQEYWKYRDSLIKRVDAEKDIIILQGGGNLGNQYMYIEKIRRDVIKHVKAEQYLFPQTMFFTDTPVGNKELRKTKMIYGTHKNLTLFAREKKSFDMMKEAFPSNSVYLVPDIVLRYRVPKMFVDRKGILLCLRNDKEGALSFSNREMIKKECLAQCSDVRCTDTCIKLYISKAERKDAVYRKLNQIASAKVVITDRLHGMIFAALTQTPCIVLSNYNHKIKGVYEWISRLDYIRYLDNEDQLHVTLNELLNYNGKSEYCFSQIEDQCSRIIDCIRS